MQLYIYVFITGKSNLKRETSNSNAGSSKNFFLSQLSGVTDLSSTSNDNEVDYEDDTETQGVTRYVYIMSNVIIATGDRPKDCEQKRANSRCHYLLLLI